MTQINPGSVVSVHYIGTLDNGKIFDSTADDQPLVFTVGAGEIFPALEQVISGMRIGEVRNVVIPAAQAYGPRSTENVLSVKKSAFPAGKEIRRGQKLAVEFNGGSNRVMIVSEVSEDVVVLDGNHPLAGLDLTFAIRLDAVN
ncbi:FKBP-type peptidyl-prolyl cis-trans isomerase [Geomonas sp.]|uniref:FKBP-type peptidyl-prolyl cis-trans isomerase n=1 Tax=Geomonas sp. TaxID=2651584 RepID=UPI002B48EDD7|nr:FKBP-type peptidyl-prolyl cis-trans isomerase [Geomonas sp.]HJV36110.1 FKBP-type peptidyl-prolyl cis-trans isomerase [Geomonas sp.]